jgi:prepilin-type processing-associated H-X9-DG protein/prepilin-type N-terminal cleavage/methylation domain-containing protein
MRPAFTLIELLISLLIAAVLCTLLTVAVQKTRTAAACLQGANNVKQLALAARDYESANKKLPPVNISVDGWCACWFGLITAAGVDTANGTLTPYYQTPIRSPNLGGYPITFQYGGATGGYGYNQALGNELGMKLMRFSASSTFCFAEQIMLIDEADENGNWLCEPKLGMMVAPDVIAGNYGADANSLNVTQFRFGGVANVAYLDGHVEQKTPVDIEQFYTFPADVWYQWKVKFDLGLIVPEAQGYSAPP